MDGIDRNKKKFLRLVRRTFNMCTLYFQFFLTYLPQNGMDLAPFQLKKQLMVAKVSTGHFPQPFLISNL